MADQAGVPMSFVIRLQRSGGGFRGHVIAVATGQGRVFTDLAEATAFIEAQMREAARGPGAPPTPDGRGWEPEP